MIEILRKRRSIRDYSDKTIEPEKIEILKEALLRSPSSKNINPWEFIFVDDQKLICELEKCKPHGVKPLKSAPLAVVVCADETKNDVWIEDCSISSILLQLTAQSIGLGSCWVQVRNRSHSEEISAEKYIRSLLHLPDKIKVLSIITLGYALKPREGKKASELQPEKIHTNFFKN